MTVQRISGSGLWRGRAKSNLGQTQRTRRGQGSSLREPPGRPPPLCPEVRKKSRDHLKTVWASARGQAIDENILAANADKILRLWNTKCVNRYKSNTVKIRSKVYKVTHVYRKVIRSHICSEVRNNCTRSKISKLYVKYAIIRKSRNSKKFLQICQV